MRWLALLVVVAVTAVTACAGLVGFPDVPNLEDAGLDGAAAQPVGGQDGGALDGSATASDASDAAVIPLDAPAAPPTPDGAGASDANDASDAATDSGDAADAADAGPAPFACPSADTTVLFCSDFDKGDAAPWEWNIPLMTGKGTDAVDTVDFLSPPNGFAASSAPLLPADGYTLAALGQPLSSAAGQIDYTFHLFVRTYDSANNPPITVARLEIGPGSPSWLTLQLVLKAGQLQLTQAFPGADGGQQTQTSLVGAVGTGQWVAVNMLLDRRAESWTVTVRIDGGLKLLTQTFTTPDSQKFEVDLGMLGVLPTTTANAITFDDVTVRAY